MTPHRRGSESPVPSDVLGSTAPKVEESLSGAPGGSDPMPAPPPPSGTRAGRVIGAVRVNYVYQATVLFAGLWLTPFLVAHLGDIDYGLWIAGTQIVTWLYVMDLGVVALVPRETAYATGAASTGGDQGALPRLIDRTMMLLLWQLPVVAVVTLGVWLFLPAHYEPLTRPLLLVFAVFLVGFPFRIFPALLQGLQDLVYVAVHTSIGWTLGFVLTIVLVKLEYGLFSLAVSFVMVQVYQFASSAIRIWRRHRKVLPRRLTPLRWTEARSLLTSGTWVSVAQIAQVLLVGTDVVIITHLLGPAAVVPYAITGKLVSVLAIQPQALVQAALPGVSEIRGTSDMDRLQRVAAALGQAMLIASGLVFCIVLVVNESFVEWWGIPDNPYAGDLLTALLLLAMVLRHANFAVVLALFSLGGERRISLTTLGDGLLTVVGAIVLVGQLGYIGAPIASMLGGLLVSLPSNLRGLSARAGIPVSRWLRPLWGWTWRFAVLAVCAALAARQRVPPTFLGLAAATIAVTVIVIAVMAPVALRQPLGAYVTPRLQRFRARGLVP